MSDPLDWIDESTPAFWRVSKMRHNQLHALLVGLKRARDSWRARTIVDRIALRLQKEKYAKLQAEFAEDQAVTSDKLHTAETERDAARAQLSTVVDERDRAILDGRELSAMLNKEIARVAAERDALHAEVGELRERVRVAEHDREYWQKMHAYDCGVLRTQQELLVEILDTLVHWQDRDGHVDKSWWDEARHAVKTHRARYPEAK